MKLSVYNVVNNHLMYIFTTGDYE